MPSPKQLLLAISAVIPLMLAAACQLVAGIHERVSGTATAVGGSAGEGAGGTGGGVATTSSGGQGGTGNAGTGGVGADGGSPPCSTDPISALTDEFDGTALDENEWRIDRNTDDGNATVEVNGDVLVAAGPPPEGDSHTWAAFSSVRTHALDAEGVSVEVTSTDSDGPTGEIYFSVEHFSDWLVYAEIVVTQSGMRVETSGGATPWNGSYDETADHYWRARFADDQIVWETSPDGQEWLMKVQHAPPAGMNRCDIRVVFGVYSAGDAASARFDDVNVLP